MLRWGSFNGILKLAKFAASSQKRLLAGLLLSGALCARPACKHECDLVHKVGDVVDDVEELRRRDCGQCAEVVAKRVDGPAHGHDQLHQCESSLDVLILGALLGGLTNKDLEEDEGPAAQAKSEANHASGMVVLVGLTVVAEDKHGNGADQQPPEATSANLGACCLDDQVELNHLQRHGDGPVNVPVHNWASMDCHPVLTHVHVVDRCHQGHQSSNMDGCLPVTGNRAGLSVQEDGGGDH